MLSDPREAHAGQAIYSPLTLAAYDVAVLAISCRWLWRCPAGRLLDHYQQHISANHLDVGVGSGYFLDRVTFPHPQPRLALMDMNAHSLAHCSRRLQRFKPRILQRNVLAPIAFTGNRFDSLGLNFLLHCLPGAMRDKAVALDYLIPLLRPGGRVFGATLLQGDVPRGLAARALMRAYNGSGILDNRQDTAASLQYALESRLQDVQIQIVGCVALFSGRV